MGTPAIGEGSPPSLYPTYNSPLLPAAVHLTVKTTASVASRAPLDLRFSAVSRKRLRSARRGLSSALEGREHQKPPKLKGASFLLIV